MITTQDITIIGGGIIGLLTAREFINAGATVCLIEKNSVGQESSWAGGGILLPLYPWRQHQAITQLVIQSLSLYPELATQLLAETGLDPEWRRCGLLITQNPDIKAAINWCQENSINYAPANSEHFENLNSQPENPLWLPDIAQARNPRLIKSLFQQLINKGLRCYQHCEVNNIQISNRQINSIVTSSGQFNVNQLIITTGAWTSLWFEQFFAHRQIIQPKIKPVKGQMLLYEAQPDTLPFIVLENDQYLIPRLDGKILAGSTVEQSEFNKTTTLTAKEKLHHFAVDLLPSLKNYPLINHWAGLRPATEHGIPYIDIHPDIVNLSVNAGHFRNGLAMGPASAQLLVDLVLNRPTQIAPEAYQFSSVH